MNKYKLKKHEFPYVISSDDVFGGYHTELYRMVCDYEHDYDIDNFAEWSESNMKAILKVIDNLKEDLDTLRSEVSDLDVHIHGYR